MAEPEKTPNLTAVDKFYSQPSDDPVAAIPQETNLSESIDDGQDTNAKEKEQATRQEEQQTDSSTNESPESSAKVAEGEESGDNDAGEQVQSLSEFIDYLKEDQGLDVDQEFLEGLEIELKVNGEMVNEKLGDVINRARTLSAADDYLEDAKRKGAQMIEEARQQKEELGENVVVLGQLIQNAEQTLLSEFNGTNWDQLRKEDPAEFAARKSDIEDREKALNNLKAQASSTYRDALEKAEKAQDEALKAQLPQQREKLYQHLPEWNKDMKLAERESAEAFQYMRKLGYDENKIKLIVHNGDDLATVVKAMKFDKVSDKSNAEDKRVRKVPRILRPGSESQGKSKSNDKPAKPDRADILYGPRPSKG